MEIIGIDDFYLVLGYGTKFTRYRTYGEFYGTLLFINGTSEDTYGTYLKLYGTNILHRIENLSAIINIKEVRSCKN